MNFQTILHQIQLCARYPLSETDQYKEIVRMVWRFFADMHKGMPTYLVPGAAMHTFAYSEVVSALRSDQLVEVVIEDEHICMVQSEVESCAVVLRRFGMRISEDTKDAFRQIVSLGCRIVDLTGRHQMCFQSVVDGKCSNYIHPITQYCFK